MLLAFRYPERQLARTLACLGNQYPLRAFVAFNCTLGHSGMKKVNVYTISCSYDTGRRLSIILVMTKVLLLAQTVMTSLVQGQVGAKAETRQEQWSA